MEKFGIEYVNRFMDWEEYREILGNLRRTFRVNRLKISLERFKEFSKIPYEKTILDFAFYVPLDYPIGRTLEYFLGYIHTQTLSSMIPPIVLNPKPHSKVLDSCAAPGGKTTQLADIMKNTGGIVANEIKIDRLSSLVGNINRLGVMNTIVISRDARNIGYKDYFDYALADVPCSNLGSSIRAVESVTKKRIRNIARVQRRILLSVFDSLKRGGELVYSTCTITEEENEAVVKFLLENREAELINIELNFPHERGLADYGREFRKTVRIYPKHINSEGFFIAKIKKL